MSQATLALCCLQNQEKVENEVVFNDECFL